jgi:hypothetical protein
LPQVLVVVAIAGLGALLVADLIKPRPDQLEVAELGMCFIAVDGAGGARHGAPSARHGAPSALHAVRQCPALASAQQVAVFRIEEAQRMGGRQRWQRPCRVCELMLRDHRRDRAKREEVNIMLVDRVSRLDSGR